MIMYPPGGPECVTHHDGKGNVLRLRRGKDPAMQAYIDDPMRPHLAYVIEYQVGSDDGYLYCQTQNPPEDPFFTLLRVKAASNPQGSCQNCLENLPHAKDLACMPSTGWNLACVKARCHRRVGHLCGQVWLT